jgi:hypothetical protein
MATATYMAWRVADRRKENIHFLKATTTARVGAVGICLVFLAAFFNYFVLHIYSPNLTPELDSVKELVGAAIFLAMVGPGYTEYREGMSVAPSDS